MYRINIKCVCISIVAMNFCTEAHQLDQWSQWKLGQSRTNTLVIGSSTPWRASISDEPLIIPADEVFCYVQFEVGGGSMFCETAQACN